MQHKTITVKASATLLNDLDFKEYEYPVLNKYLNEGWEIKDVHQSITNQNVGFLFLTFILAKR